MSYDTPDIVTKKAQYVISNGLAGSMFWDVGRGNSAGLLYAPEADSVTFPFV